MNLPGPARAARTRLVRNPIIDGLDGLDTVDLVTRLTLLLLLAFSNVVEGHWWFMAPLTVCALLGMLTPGLHRNRRLWLVITLVLCVKTIDNWWTQDNHLFLLTYWSMSLWLALGLEAPEPVLRTSAKLLIGGTFLMATVWRGALSSEFLDGTFFHYTLATDPRFRGLGILVSEMVGGSFDKNYAAVEQIRQGMASVTLASARGLEVMAVVLTWWTMLIEGSLAVLFLWPSERGPARFKNPALLLFGLTTYLVAPVPSFGWLLMTLGATQCRPDERRTRTWFVLTGILILVYKYLNPAQLIASFT